MITYIELWKSKSTWQNMSAEDEHKIAEGLNAIAFENSMIDDEDKYIKLIKSLEEELSDWK